MAFGFNRPMSSTQSRMGSMGMSGNRPGDAASLGGRFGSQPPPRSSGGGRFGIGPSRPPMMPPAQRTDPMQQGRGNKFGLIKNAARKMQQPTSSRRIVRPPMDRSQMPYVPPPMQGGEPQFNEQMPSPIGPRMSLLERFNMGGPMRGFN